MNPFHKLASDELAALAKLVTPPLSALATGDGSTASLVGQGIALQGALVAALPALQKVGVNDLAAWLLELVNSATAPAPAK